MPPSPWHDHDLGMGPGLAVGPLWGYRQKMSKQNMPALCRQDGQMTKAHACGAPATVALYQQGHTCHG